MSGHPSELIDKAKAVLEHNRAGDSTKPSPDLYPHQWMWDACFIAIGISNYDPVRAQTEIRSLLRGQWSNGMVPQIVFNPDATGYFPGPDVWQSKRSPHAPKKVETSGITQPPVLATAVLAAFQRDPDRDRAKEFATDVLPKVVAYHQFLYRERNPDNSGLIVVVHPWESGLDNSPPYLDAAERVHLTYRPQYTRLDTLHVAAANRPTNKDYDLFVWLLEQMREVDYDWSRYLPTATMQVEDVLFNAILVKANRDLASLAEALGEAIPDLESLGTLEAIQEQLWDADAGLYFSRDRLTEELITEPTIASLSPLLLGSETLAQERKSRLLAALSNEKLFGPSGYICPTTAPTSRRFNPENYWLGPVWVNTNWLLLRGLEADPDAGKIVDRLRNDTLYLIAKSGFREYFNPFTGEGYGTDSFSWSAALTIDLLSDSISA